MPVPTSYEAYHLFSLPPALLDNITLREDHSVAQQDESVTSGIKPSDSTTLAPVGSGRACNVCLNATFAGVDEQRSHFRSDWHRYNVKTKLGGGHAVDEPRFASLVEGMLILLLVMLSRSDYFTQVSKTRSLARLPLPLKTMNQIQMPFLHCFLALS
jgi:hypothetical protein